MTDFSSIPPPLWATLPLSAMSRTIPGGKEMSFFDEFERSYTGDQNKKDKKSRNERKEQDRQMETEQKQRRDRNDPML